MTDKNSLPPSWGPPIHSHQFVLWQEGDKGPTDQPTFLQGHGLATGSPEVSEAITYTRTKLINGRLVPVMQTLRGAIEMAVAYDIGIPSALWTPVMIASYQGCIKTFFLQYLCPDDEEFAHWIILENGALTPAIESNDLIVAEETGEAITHTSTITVERRLWGWNLAYRPVYAAGGTIVLNGVAFLGEDCPGCESNLGKGLIAVGGDATAAPTVVVTDDRFTSVTTPTVAVPLDVAYCTYAEGPVQLVATGDAADPSLATAAEVWRSIDGGENFVVCPNIDIVVYKFVKVGDDILAIGVTTTGAAAVWIARDGGGTFVNLPSANLPASEALLSGAYDEGTLKVYFGGAAGTLLAGRLSSTGLNVSDITANLGGTPTTITEVVVLGKGNLVVVGAVGIVKESWDSAANWLVIPFPTTDDITCAAGNKYRLVIGADILAYERSFLTKNLIQVVTLEEGEVLTGSITDIAINEPDVEGNFNRIAVVTDAGEVALGLPRYPAA